MVGRVLVTFLMLLAAAGGFFGAAPGPTGPLNPFGILFLFLSGVVWFAWDLIRDAFGSRLDVMQRVDLMKVQLGRPQRRQRRASTSADDPSPDRKPRRPHR